MKRYSYVIIIAFIVLAIIVTFSIIKTKTPVMVIDTKNDISVAFYCDEGNKIFATFDNTEGERNVTLRLTDGKIIKLNQTISASGARYANSDESIVFWNKGNGATLTSGNSQIYMGCIAVKNDPGNLPQVYENGSRGFSIRYPVGYSVDENYKYEALGPGKEIYGVKFTIPTSTAQGTNLSRDSYISVEQINNASSCGSAKFFDSRQLAQVEQEINGTLYSIASSTGAGLGNRYEETVYTIPGTNLCLSIRYFIHYTVFENYPAGTIKEFDKDKLIKEFDSIRDSLNII